MTTTNTTEKAEARTAEVTAQFTPGPWIENADETVERLNAVIGLDGQVVCDNVYGDGKEEAAANMRLITAAPELLEALKELLEWTYDTSKTAPRVKAQKSIAKAEGRE